MQLILTRTIKDAIKEGYSSEFIYLLEEFGKWSRYFGCMGWGHCSIKQSYVMDDETGAALDVAFAYLKKEHPALYRLMRRHYVDGLNEIQIMREERERHSRRYKRFKYISSDMIAERIKAGNIYILELLQSCE